ncbi:MAG: D-2-hydroxyacid dehydrogenase [Actinomycetota bacterium]|nr:D-2-hydroxyacid dehydrogenase [Actinomycetota bacterium]
MAGPQRARAAVAGMESSGDVGEEVRFVVLSEDGVAAEDEAADVEVLWRHGRPERRWTEAAIASLPNLEWVHSDFVGVDVLPLDEFRSRGILLTNGAGNYSRPMAEWVLLAMLAAVKRFPTVVRSSDRGVWQLPGTLDELWGKTVLMLGFGTVHQIVAPLAEAMGMEVVATARRPREHLPAGVTRWAQGDEWRRELHRSDFVVVGLPHTPETDRIVDGEVFGRMKEGAWLVNLARGSLVDERALVDALDAGRLGGALLDSFVEEPLPEDHPLWRRPNVIVVPHHSWSSHQVMVRIEDLFRRQLTAWASGEELDNVVDLSAGY